jgi:WD40 repeat protein
VTLRPVISLYLLALFFIGGCGQPPKAASPPKPIRAVAPPPQAPEPDLGAAITAVAISPDGYRIITANLASDELRIFTAQPVELDRVKKTDRTVQEIAFSHKPGWIAADERGHTGPSRCFLIEDGNWEAQHILHGAQDFAHLAFSADDKRLFGVSFGGVMAWRVEDGRRLYFHTPFGKASFFECHGQFVPGSDGRYVAVEGDERWILWDAPAGRQVATSGVRSKDGQDVLLWFMEGGNPTLLRTVEKPNAPASLSVVDGFSGRVRRSFALHPLLKSAIGEWRAGQASPDGRLFAVRVERKKRLALFSLATGELVRLLEPPGGAVSQDWSFLSPRVVTAPTQQGIVFWDVETGRIRITLVPDLLGADGPRGADGEWIAYTPDGRHTGSKGCLQSFKRPGLTLKADPTHIEQVVGELFPRRPRPQ